MKVVYENILVELPAEESKRSGVYVPEEDRKVKLTIEGRKYIVMNFKDILIIL